MFHFQFSDKFGVTLRYDGVTGRRSRGPPVIILKSVKKIVTQRFLRTVLLQFFLVYLHFQGIKKRGTLKNQFALFWKHLNFYFYCYPFLRRHGKTKKIMQIHRCVRQPCPKHGSLSEVDNYWSN